MKRHRQGGECIESLKFTANFLSLLWQVLLGAIQCPIVNSRKWCAPCVCQWLEHCHAAVFCCFRRYDHFREISHNSAWNTATAFHVVCPAHAVTRRYRVWCRVQKWTHLVSPTVINGESTKQLRKSTSSNAVNAHNARSVLAGTKTSVLEVRDAYFWTIAQSWPETWQLTLRPPSQGIILLWEFQYHRFLDCTTVNLACATDDFALNRQ